MTEGNMSDMMAKLAAAEAEAEKLRSELKESARAPDLDELAKRIDELAKQKPPSRRIASTAKAVARRSLEPRRTRATPG